MHSSQPWNEGPYFRFKSSSISHEFNIPIDEVEDVQAFVVSPDKMEIGTKEWISGNWHVYAIGFSDINRLATNMGYPVKKDFWKNNLPLQLKGLENDVTFPSVMSIINMTPDSFYPGSRTVDKDLEARLDEIAEAGGNLVDIGGQSTRPGSVQITPEEEMKRISKAVEMSLNRKFVVSIDSYHPDILRECMEMGAHIINDVTGMENPEIGKIAKRYDVPLIIMHKKGDFETMQISPSYENVVDEIISFFLDRIAKARILGIEDNLILDPGIGFGKRVKDNLAIINNLRDFKLGHPLLIGLSRKNYIGKIMEEDVEERAESSLIFDSIAIMNGADIIRVHDVKENMKLIKIIKKLKENYM